MYILFCMLLLLPLSILLFNSMHESVTSIRQPRPTATTPPSPTQVSTTTAPSIAHDCSEIKNQGFTENYEIYYIRPSDDSESFDVVCDMETDGEEWVVFQRRFDGSVSFPEVKVGESSWTQRTWEDYKNGFGNLTGEHWLGLEKLHRLTNNGDWLLRIEINDTYGDTGYAEYTNFAIGDESTNYRLSIGDYSGTAGNSLTYHDNMAFSTYDRDHDNATYNCAEFRGGWWFNACLQSNLNGRHYHERTHHVSEIYWFGWKDQSTAITKTEMKMRRVR